MANYNKSFNFRNGVQVDEDDLIVRNSLVGIGTSIPGTELDVYGVSNPNNAVVRVNGLTTTTNLYVSGIATFNDIQIGTGITIIGNSGTIAAKFYGDGAGLYNIPTSQWVDVDPAVFAPFPPPPGAGTGYTSIYAAGTVGIGTTIPRFYLQIGGDPTLSQNGVGISSTGNVIVSGILTSGFFVGSGAGVTSIDASNISSGTLNNSRLPSDINVSNITVGSFISTNTNISGVATIGFATITNSYIGVGTFETLFGGNLTGNDGNLATLYANSGVVTSLSGTQFTYSDGNLSNLYSVSGVVTSLSGTNLNYSGIATIGLVSATNAEIGVATIGFATITSGYFNDLRSVNINVSGTHTVGYLTASSSFIGYSTGLSLNSGNIRVANPIQQNLIDTVTGDLTLDSATNLVTIDSNLSVSGISSLTGEVTVNTGIVPDTSVGAYLGQTGKEFSEAYIDAIQIGVGLGNENKITTSSGDLFLDSNSNRVVVDANLTISGITTFDSGITLGSSLLPSTNLSADLGSSLLRFNAAYIDQIRIGAASSDIIDTISGNLNLNSNSGLVAVSNRFLVSGISTFSNRVDLITGIVPQASNTAYVGSSSLPFAEAYIDAIRIGVAGTNIIDTSSGTNLVLDSSSGTTFIDDDLNVSGISSFTGDIYISEKSYIAGITTVAGGIVPHIDLGSNVGSSAKRFGGAYLNDITVGIAQSNKISTQYSPLILGSFDNIVEIDGNINVSGISSFASELIPFSDSTNSIGTSGRSFGQAYVGEIQIGVGASNIIDTRSSDLNLNSTTGLVKVNQNFRVVNNAIFDGGVSFSNDTLIIDSPNSRVGIGSTQPTVELDIIGNTLIDGILNVGVAGSTITLDGNSETLTVKNLFVTGTTTGVTASGVGVTVVSIIPDQRGAVSALTFEKDFRLTNIYNGIVSIFLSNNIGIGSTDTIGIGTDQTDPNVKLHVQGSTYISNSLFVDDVIACSGGFLSGIAGTSVSIGATDGRVILSAPGIGTVSLVADNTTAVFQDLWISDEVDKTYTLSNVGIGTTNPTSKLHVIGDARVGVDTSQGVILTSENGTKYRLIVSNAGVLSTVLVP